MKNFISVLVMAIVTLFVADNSFAQTTATSVERRGFNGAITQYKINDPGKPYDNHLIYVGESLDEVVVQVSSVNTHTYKENWGCWGEDPNNPECPNDDMDPPNEVWRMPTIMLLNDIWMAGNNTMGAGLSELTTKAIYLSFWHEYKMRKVAADAVAEMDLEGMNDLQKRRSLKYVYFGNGIDLTTSQAIANNYITNSIKPTYADYNLATVPLADRRLLILFGEVVESWFVQ